jgi:predicted permease
LIFQQLGQLLRWTWGYSVLLRPASEYGPEERGETAEETIEEGRYTDNPEDSPTTKLIGNGHDSGFNSGTDTPSVANSRSRDSMHDIVPAAPGNGNDISTEPRNLVRPGSSSDDDLTQFPNFSRANSTNRPPQQPEHKGWKAPLYRVKNAVAVRVRRTQNTVSTFGNNLFRRFPTPVQKVLSTLNRWLSAFLAGVWRQMNPPLWAMLAALIVASVPSLQHLFFSKGTFVSNSITRAIQQSGNVAVPLILVVLGANLARSTLPQDQLATTKEEKKEERKLLYASLLSRMVLPVIIMAPVLALTAKFIPVSILDDPIFIIVCFLLTGAPSALQLAQICQINGVFMGAMSSLLVASYVVVIFPSTLLLVLMALEVLEWAVL